MLRLLAILSMIALCAGCGPSFYERCLLGVWSTETSARQTFSPDVSGDLIRSGFRPENVGTDGVAFGDIQAMDARGKLGNVEAFCAELDARRRDR